MSFLYRMMFSINTKSFRMDFYLKKDIAVYRKVGSRILLLTYFWRI
jgi:hypothetical protein